MIGFASEDDPLGDDIGDGVQLFECSMVTDNSDLLPVPNPVLLKIHTCFAKATEANDIDREVAKPWPPALSHCLSPTRTPLCDLSTNAAA